MDTQIIDKRVISWISTMNKIDVKIEIALIKMEIGEDFYPTIAFFTNMNGKDYRCYEQSYHKRGEWAKCYDVAPDHVVGLLSFANDCLVGLDSNIMKIVDNAIKELNQHPEVLAFEQEKNKRKAQYIAQKKLERAYDIMNEGGEGYNPYRLDTKIIKEPYQKGDLTDD